MPPRRVSPSPSRARPGGLPAGEPVDEMPDGEQGVFEHHAGPGIPHDTPDLFPHAPLVAMDGACGAGGLLRAVGAIPQTFLGVLAQLPAAGTQGPFRPVTVPAVHFDHDPDGLFLAQETAFHSPHHFRANRGQLSPCPVSSTSTHPVKAPAAPSTPPPRPRRSVSFVSARGA